MHGGALNPVVDGSVSVCSYDEPVLIGHSALFGQVLKVVDSVAANDCVVLIEGESGTGKELLARRIHCKSSRSTFPFIPVNCPGVAESLFESQFYGHVKGAFTGASGDTLGIVRSAEGGTLLLDEVGELELSLQPKLLRLLQEKEVTPVGGAHPVPVNVRFIAATNRSLAKCVSENTFRPDLYHRLNIVRVVVPPLRTRTEDIEPLLDHFLQEYARQYQMPTRLLGMGLRRQLREYPWPGNIRELSSYVERLYAANLPPMPPDMSMWDDGYPPIDAQEPAPGRMPLCESFEQCPTLAQMEREAILKALKLTNHNRSAAARILDVHRSTLLRKLRSFGL